MMHTVFVGMLQNKSLYQTKPETFVHCYGVKKRYTNIAELYMYSVLQQEVPSDQEGQKSKYKVNPPKDLTSKFLKRQEQKENDRIIAEGRKKREEEEARIAASISSHNLVLLVMTGAGETSS